MPKEIGVKISRDFPINLSGNFPRKSVDFRFSLHKNPPKIKTFVDNQKNSFDCDYSCDYWCNNCPYDVTGVDCCPGNARVRNCFCRFSPDLMSPILEEEFPEEVDKSSHKIPNNNNGEQSSAIVAIGSNSGVACNYNIVANDFILNLVDDLEFIDTEAEDDHLYCYNSDDNECLDEYNDLDVYSNDGSVLDCEEYMKYLDDEQFDEEISVASKKVVERKDSSNVARSVQTTKTSVSKSPGKFFKSMMQCLASQAK